MPHLALPPLLPYAGDRSNLEALRAQLTGRLALLGLGVSLLAIWWTLSREAFPLHAFGLWVGLLLLSLGVRECLPRWPAVARHGMFLGLTLLLLVAMVLLDQPWLPFLGVQLILVGMMLAPASALLLVVGVAVLVWQLAGSTGRAYPVPALLVLLAASVVLAWLVTRTLYTALEWAWSTQQRANRLLEETRSHRAELARTLKSLKASLAALDRTQRELIAARRQADEARQVKEQFAANISHELRTPLNLILGFSELMHLSPHVYGDLRWPSTLRRDVYQIYRSSGHLLELIDDILALSRFETVGFTLQREPTEIEPLVRGAVEIVADLFRDRAVQLEVEVDADVRPLLLDPTRIRQVLLNLLNNAHRFTEAGCVRVTAHTDGAQVVVSVSDTGLGIPADKLPHIFDEFYQVDLTLRRPHGGAGLGLAISKRFVEAHGGRIWVESKEGIGTTFFFSLPSDPQQSLAVWRGAHPADKRPESATRPCLLVVDPDPAVAALVQRALETYDVVSVAAADSCDDMIMTHHPRAVLWNVPPGQHAAHVESSLPVPVIECSLPSRSMAMHDLAVRACLTKPVTAQQIMETIAEIGDVEHVLIVDDDRGFCHLIERTLLSTRRPFHITHAYNGAQALKAIRGHLPDLVLLDLIMPEVDGFQVLQTLRDDPTLAQVPVVLLSATSYAEDVVRQHGNRITITKTGGLLPREVLSCLEALVAVLEPGYDDRYQGIEALRNEAQRYTMLS